MKAAEETKDQTLAARLKEKLTSRKFWAALLSAVLAITVTLFGDSFPESDLSALRAGITGLIAYIFGESAVDVTRVIVGK